MTRVFTIFSTIILLSTLCFGQETVEDENWLKGFNTEADSFPTLAYWEPKKFTLEDVAAGKQRLNSIRRFVPQNEWEGLYYANSDIGDVRFIWNSEGGFFDFYFYHTLKYFYFGKIKDSSGFIELDYEKVPVSQTGKKSISKTKLIKVRIDETHFLVPENQLRGFCELAAGLSTNAQDVYNHRIKEEDMQKPRLGLPVLPAEYEKYLRYPVEAEISRVRSRKIAWRESYPASKEIRYTLNINAGRNKKIKIGMNFFVKELGEWITVAKVFQTNSIGYIRRDFDENNREQCWGSEGGSGQTVPCQKIKIEMKAKTKGDLCFGCLQPLRHKS